MAATLLLHCAAVCSDPDPVAWKTPSSADKDLDPVERASLRAAWNEPVLWPAYSLVFLALLVVLPGIRTYLKERQ